jgi:hypothetical protein
MSRYLLIAIIPLILWPIWGSWVVTPCSPSTTTTATTTITTTIFDTFVLTSTIPPTTTLTVSSSEEQRLYYERIRRETREHKEKYDREKAAWEAEMSWKKKMRKSWFVWFMEYCYFPVAWGLVGCVCVFVWWLIGRFWGRGGIGCWRRNRGRGNGWRRKGWKRRGRKCVMGVVVKRRDRFEKPHKVSVARRRVTS